MSESPFEKLEELVVDLMRQSKVPGLSIGVVVDGKPAYARAFGARNLEKNLPMTPDTLWGIASISKSFCAMAVMQLDEQGKIDLNAPVSDYIDFKLGREDNTIRVHHLLCHSSGIPELDATSAATIKESFIPMSSERDFMTFVNKAKDEIVDEPEKLFMYNNDMYTILGFIVEKVTGMRYSDYVRESILKPLEMERSTYLREEFEADQDTISGYAPSKDGKSLDSKEIKIDELDYACGGLYSSVRELQNYMIALMDGGEFEGRRIVSRESIEKMWTPYIKTPESYTRGEGGYGYGWSIEKDFLGHTLVHHGGNIPTSGGFLAMIPEKKIGAVVGQIPNPTGIHTTIVRGLLAQLLGEDMNKAVPILEAQKKLELIQGKYKTVGLVEAEISLKNGILHATLSFSGLVEPVTIPLAVDDLKELRFSVPYTFPGRELKLKFIVDEETGKVHLRADRYYFHKM